MTYAIIKNSDGVATIISNAIKDGDSNTVYVSNLVKNTAGDDAVVFGNNPIGRKVASGPVFIVPARNRTFVV